MNNEWPNDNQLLNKNKKNNETWLQIAEWSQMTEYKFQRLIFFANVLNLDDWIKRPMTSMKETAQKPQEDETNWEDQKNTDWSRLRTEKFIIA